jgi:hypothetical protein
MRKLKYIRFAILIIIVTAGVSLLSYPIYRFSVQHSRKLHADINTDGRTDETDYRIFLQKYGQSCIGCIEDINNDRFVDGKDMLILLGEINKTSNAQ